jgi:molecular chaperone GrpE
VTDEAASGASGPIDWAGQGGSDRPDAAEGDAPAPSIDAMTSPEPDDDTSGTAAELDGDQAPEAGEDGDPHDAGASVPGDGPASAGSEAERDEYIDRLQRLQAEFENYRKRMTREHTEAAGRGSQALAAELLPVLDGCDAALQQGRADVEPIRDQLVEILTKAGLEQNGAPGDPFDPECHDAVMHEPADDPADESTIAEVLRTGYSWKGRVLRPAMVKVKG